MSWLERQAAIAELAAYELGLPWWTAPATCFAAGLLAGALLAWAWQRRRRTWRGKPGGYGR